MNQEDFTNHLNFEYYMVSSPREMEAFSYYPVFIEPDIYKQIISAAAILYNLVGRLSELLDDTVNNFPFLLPDFPFRQKILGLDADLPPFFWTRYDAFERADGGIFFSEFNYDKPCAQREIMVSDWLNPEGNPNRRFAENFRQGLVKLWQDYGSGAPCPSIGIMVDPNHYEEAHLAFIYMDIIKPLNYPCILLGGKNLRVINGVATAFGQPLDIILRQYPTEFSNEIHDYSRLLELINQRKVLMVNDPRAIVPQAKSLFAYLWDLYNNHASVLTDEELRSIRGTIPYTRIFTPDDMPDLELDRERWVVKPVFGRYSEGVNIGAMMGSHEWQSALHHISQSAVPHVMQEFIPIRRRLAKCFNGIHYEDTVAFCNFGVYFTLGEFSGICARLSPDYLSLDDSAWFCPVGVRQDAAASITVQPSARSEAEHRRLWDDIANQAAFKYNYTASYTADWESFTLEPVLISRALYNEVVNATEELGRIFLKTRKFLQNNMALFAPLLNIPDCLQPLVQDDEDPWLSWLSRFDWAVDTNGGLRLLEINTDTPAGLESVVLNRLLHYLCPDTENPNQLLPDLLLEQYRLFFEKIDPRMIKVLGLAGCPASEEDWFHLMFVGNLLESLDIDVILGDISGLKIKNGDLTLNGNKVDALYRHYPLDWFADDGYLKRLIPGLNKHYLINPASALIPQSKAFLAIALQLCQEGFYTTEEAQLIRHYVVPTYLCQPEKPCIIKPYWGREGSGVVFSGQIQPDELAVLAEQDLVYQELVDIAPVDIVIRNAFEKRFMAAYPIVGAFLVGSRFGGLYTRLGARITDRYAVVAPTFVEVC